MAALYKACFPIYLVLLTLGGFTSANRQLKETHHHQQKTAASMNLQGSDSGNSNDSSGGNGHGAGLGAGVGNTIGGVAVGIPGGITIPGVFPGIQIPGISMGFPGISIGIPGINVGIPGVSVHTPGISVQTPGISVGTPGVSVGGGGQGVVYVPCPVYLPGYGCVSAHPAQVQAIRGGRLVYVSDSEMDSTHQVASKDSIGQEAGKDHKMVVN